MKVNSYCNLLLYMYIFCIRKQVLVFLRQMIVIFILWLNVTVSLYITLFKDVELSLFILPFNVFLVLLLTPLLLISIFKEFKGDDKNETDRKI